MEYTLEYPDIKKCPFCGYTHPSLTKLTHDTYYVHCNSCMAYGPMAYMHSEKGESLSISMVKAEIGAIVLWNKAWEEKQ